MSTRFRITLSAALVAPALLAARAASACPATPPACSSLPGPVLTIESGDTQQNLLKTLGQKLRNSATRPMTIVYFLNGSCTLSQDMFSANKLTVNLSYVPSTTEDSTWTPASAACTCTPDTGGSTIDMAISALYVASCNLGTPPTGLGILNGPKLGYGFIIPKASTQTAIVAEEAYLTFGFGNNDQLMPWNNTADMFIRPITKSTLVSMAANIGVPPAKWQGTSEASSTNVLTAVSTSAAPEPTIGILGIDLYDQNRSTVSLLAYRAYQQNLAFWPDSSSTTFNKKSMRDGHYTMWSDTQYLTAVDSTNTPTNANAKYWIDLVLGNTPNPASDINGLQSVANVSLVPDCAMEVSRTADGGPLALYSPAVPCGCFFESNVGSSPATPPYCTACTTDANCSTGQHCRYGYCEAR